MKKAKIFGFIGLVLVIFLWFTLDRNIFQHGYGMRERAGEGLVLAFTYKNRVVDFYMKNNHTWPTGTTAEILKQVDLPPFISTKNTQSITIEENGLIKIEHTSKVHSGGVLYLEPRVQEGSNRIIWRCYSNNVPRSKLPSECRKSE